MMHNKNVATGVSLLILILIVFIASQLLNIFSKNGYAEPNLIATTTFSTATDTAPYSNTTKEGYNLYSNKKYAFSIVYPASLTKINQETAGDLDDLDTTDIFTADMPRDTFKGTNLSEVRIIAGAKKTDPDICAEEIYGNVATDFGGYAGPEKVEIKGITFVKVRVHDSGAGNFYDTTRYSTYKNGVCFELLAVAHSTNIGILQQTNPNIKQYDESIFLPEFEEIVSSFKFIE